MKKSMIYSFLTIGLLFCVQYVSAQNQPTSSPTQKLNPAGSSDTIRPKFPPRDTVRKTERRDTSQWRRQVDTTSSAIERKTRETGAKVVAGIKDCSLKNVKGPKGETVYVDEYDRRYYINKDGNKVFMKRPTNMYK